MRNRRSSDKNKNRIRMNEMLAMVFIFLLAILVILCLVIPDKDFSEKENRSLQKLPKITVGGLVSGRTQSELESYATDQMAFRNAWVGLQTKVSILMGRNESKGVFRGEEDYLIQDFNVPSAESIKTQTDAVLKFADTHADLNHYFMLVPTAAEILSDKLPENAPVDSQRKYMDIFSYQLGEAVKFIDVTDTLNEHNQEYIYYKTDHHWTTLGAYYAYTKAAQDMGLDISSDNLVSYPVSTDFQGTMCATSGYGRGTRDTVEVYFNEDKNQTQVVEYVDEKTKAVSMYDITALERSNNYEIFFGGNHPMMIIKTTAANDRCLLLFKDSYANCFIPFLTNHFSEIVVVDPRYFYEDPDDIILTEGVTDVMYLYNADTLSTDTGLAPVLRNE